MSSSIATYKKVIAPGRPPTELLRTELNMGCSCVHVLQHCNTCNRNGGVGGNACQHCQLVTLKYAGYLDNTEHCNAANDLLLQHSLQGCIHEIHVGLIAAKFL
jgi:hypothetical protein